ncbi:hypothetical protein EDC04DRAFT_2959178 [Pisolithus marmoratus]|nr:hypothetical protein EDC04DRAFT_2959178 [Pisolithus marmoratus]
MATWPICDNTLAMLLLQQTINAMLDAPLCHSTEPPIPFVPSLMRSVTRHEAMLYSLRVPRPKVVTRMADAIVIPISKPFGRVPKRKADDDAIELPAKRSVARSFSINHDMLPESKPLLVSFGQVPKRKAEGDSPGPPPKKRAIKSPSTCHVMPQECCLWRLPNELLFDIVDLLDTDSLRRLSQVCKLLQDVSGRRYLAAVGFKLPIAGWLDVNEAGCVALPVWRHVAFRAVDVMWFTSSRTLSRHQLGAMCAFFDSLQDTQVVRKVYFHLYHDPSCIPPAFSSLLASIRNSGCTELHASTHNVSGGPVHIPRKPNLFPSSRSSLTSLDIDSPIFFFPHSILFTLSVLQTARLTSLRLVNTGLSPVQWASLLRKINLPCLTELEVDRACPIRSLTACLIAHQTISKLTISHYGVPTTSAEYNTHRPILHSLQELVGPATAILSLLKLVTLPNDFRCLRIRFPPYYPEENALSSILSCAEYLPQLPSLEISMPMITSADELAAFAAFPTNDKCILPALAPDFQGNAPSPVVHQMSWM